MANLYVARRVPRRALFLPMGTSKTNPSMIFPLDKTDRNELDELVRAQLAKLGITKESDVQATIDKAETDYEYRIKVEEARKELRRLMAEREKGNKLMQVGFRKWKPVFYPGVKRR